MLLIDKLGSYFLGPFISDCNYPLEKKSELCEAEDEAALAWWW